MDLKLKHIGSRGSSSAKIIEFTVEGFGSSITEDATDLNGFVDEDLIFSLRKVANELEDQNRKKKEENDNQIDEMAEHYGE